MKKTPLLLAMMIIATGQVGVSIYLPALPMIAESLHVNQAEVQQLVTLFLIGFGLSQLCYGPLSDAIGRRPVFILGQGIYLLGTLLCVSFSDHLLILEGGRLLQGLGAGSASVLGRSVLRDSYDGAELTKAFFYISVTASVMPIVAPVLGGWLTFHLSWVAVFSFVLFYLSAIFVLGLLIMPETLPYRKKRFKPAKLVRNYAELLTNAQVIESASYNWLTYLGGVVSLSVLPFIMQNGLGLTAAQYGSVMIIPSAGLLLGTLTLNVINRRYTPVEILRFAITVLFLAGLCLLLLEPSLGSLVLAFTLLTFAQGLSFPLSISLLLAPHKTQAGTVSALSGSIQMCLSGVLGGYLVTHWLTTPLALGVFYLMIALSMTIILHSHQPQPMMQKDCA